MKATALTSSLLLLCSTLLTACNGQIAIPLQGTVPPRSQSSVSVQHEAIETIEDEVIVKYRSGFSTQASRPLPAGIQVLDAFQNADENTQLQRLPKNLKMDQALQNYAADPSVEFAVPNMRFKVQMNLLDKSKNLLKPVSKSSGQTLSTRAVLPERVSTLSESIQAQDPLSGDQWYLADMSMNQVWTEHGTGSSGVTVAVLDTGVDYTHPDLDGRIIKGPDYIDQDFDPKDEHGHGTHVAGIIAAGLNNSQGITGIAPQVRVMAIRVLNAKGSGSLFHIAKGIAYAANNGAKVINLSLGSSSAGSIMKTLANYLASYADRKGALIIAAAGNAGGAIGFPAAASKFLAVGAVNEQKYLASFSNRGPEVDLVAPGVNIMSTFPTYDVTANESGLPHDYASLNGTSMATPIVSALAALVLSQDPYLTPGQLRERLESTATDLGSIGRDNLFGAGLINPIKALEKSTD